MVFTVDLSTLAQSHQSAFPYPHTLVDNFLDTEFALQVQEEILNLPDDKFDRYHNPFEDKSTLRDKNDLPPKTQKLFDHLQSDEFLNKLSTMVGHKLVLDPTKNFWGIHKAREGSKLDIHVDAGTHPVTKQKKQVTLGLYLSKNWKPQYGGELEIWDGENSVDNKAKLRICVTKAVPDFNRLVIFNCDDNSWHGSPSPIECPEEATRIFLTMSYLSDNKEFENKRSKAFFVKLPDEPEDEEKDKLRLMRADPELFKQVYRT